MTEESEIIKAYDDLVLRNSVDLDTKDYNIIRDATSDISSGLWAAETHAYLDAMTLKSLFFNEDWVFILVDTIASDISMVPLRVMKSEIKDGQAVEVPAEGHPLNDLLDQPNEWQSYHNWMYSVVVDFNIGGNAIIWWAPVSKQLVQIPMESVRLEFDQVSHQLSSYAIVQMSPDDIPVINSAMKLPVSNVIHIRRPNPSSMMWGLSPFIPGRKSVLFNRYSLEYMNNYYIKGALPGLALEMSQDANEKTALRLLRSFEMAHTGRRNQRRNMIMPKGVTVKEITHSLADQELKDYLVLNRETIINILKIPKQRLSITEPGRGSGLNSEEFKTAMRVYWGTTLKSQMSMIASSLTAKLAPQLGEGYYIDFDCSAVDAFKEDENAKADLAIKMLSTHTLNEIRAKLYNEPALPNGDTTPGTTNAPTISANPVAAVNQAAEAQKNLGDSKALRSFGAFIKGSGESWWKNRESLLQESYDKDSRKIHKLAIETFANQAVEVVAAIKATVKEKARIPSKTTLKRRIEDALDKMKSEWENGYEDSLIGSVETGYDVGVKLPFGLPNQDELNAIRARNADNRRQILSERGLDTFANMNQTTTDKIMNEVEAGIKNGETVQDIAKRVASKMTNPDDVAGRAMTIARTETLTANSIGQAAVMEDAASVIPNMKKMWVNAGDDRVRGNPQGLYPKSQADHWELGGMVIDYDEKFKNGLSFPRDPAGDASETINCRCSFIMFPEDEASNIGVENTEVET